MYVLMGKQPYKPEPDESTLLPDFLLSFKKFLLKLGKNYLTKSDPLNNDELGSPLIEVTQDLKGRKIFQSIRK
jgi:hypothetical protein